jgi:formylglycine-generating enzyme required for sulfatase activity
VEGFNVKTSVYRLQLLALTLLLCFQSSLVLIADEETSLAWIMSYPFYDRPTSEIILPNGRRIYNYPSENDFLNATVIIDSDLSNGPWRLFVGPSLIQIGNGSTQLQVRPNTTYQLQAGNVAGYNVEINPATFTTRPGSTSRVQIKYRPSYGQMTLNSAFPAGESLRISITPLSRQTAPTQATVRASNGQIQWKSPSLTTGLYEVRYVLPSYFTPLTPYQVEVREGQTTPLQLPLIASRSVRVHSNVPQASFILTNRNTQQTWQGGGTFYTFSNLLPGSYELQLLSADPDRWLASAPQRFELTAARDLDIKADYRPVGQLNITANVARATVSISSTQGERINMTETIGENTRSFALPAGRYRLSFAPVTGDARLIYGSNRPDPTEITVQPGQMTTFEAIYERLASATTQATTAAAPADATLTVTTPSNRATFSITNTTLNTPAQRFQGQQLHLPLSVGNYYVEFDPLPNMRTPASQTITLQMGDAITLQADYIPQISTVNVAAGMSVIGDPYAEGNLDERPPRRVFIDAFSMGTYEVTNAQYASWLNDAVRAGELNYQSSGDKRGCVLDASNNIICRCIEAISSSQIYASQRGNDNWYFYPVIGKDNYPVIEVSWHGAHAYCRAHHGRLPTEAEWEKAAAVPPTAADTALKKYRYGFSSDTIDRTQANYKVRTSAIKQLNVLTTSVGFYNGVNLIPLNLMEQQQATTQNAISPYGAYDMSGNVWEWVHDWYDASYYAVIPEKNPTGPSSGTHKVAKGGCYDSLSFSVRAATRMALLPNHSDAFTGFRIAFDLSTDADTQSKPSSE